MVVEEAVVEFVEDVGEKFTDSDISENIYILLIFHKILSAALLWERDLGLCQSRSQSAL